MYKATVEFSNLFWSGLADSILKHEEVNVCDMSSGHIEWFKGEFLNVTGKYYLVRTYGTFSLYRAVP